MSKKFKTKKWDFVPLDGFPAAMMDKLQGFIGLEECTDYGLDKTSKRTKKLQKISQPKKRKHDLNGTLEPIQEVPQKKVKLMNGFIVEKCKKVKPSKTNDIKEKEEKKPKKSKKVKAQKEIAKKDPIKKDQKPKLGENAATVSNLTKEDMLSWAEFKLPEDIVKALMEQGFKNPTKIQQLALPAAIHGRRDILGAAETGSGKTLAFGLPILTGIIKLKEKAALKGLDVYDIPFKKPSIKKKNKHNDQIRGKDRKNKIKNKKIVTINGNQKVKESSEDGYISGDEDTESLNSDNHSEANNDSEFIEEIEVPLRKSKESEDEGNKSEDSSDDNYVHLSDMLDSDDLKSSDDETGDEHEDIGDDSKLSDDEDNEFRDGEETDGIDEVDEINGNEDGMGCVKVIDNIELPEQVMVKTGKPLYALILTPTRELAIQISRHLTAAAKYTGIRIATIVGGMASVKQERVLSRGPEIVVATPGRLWQLLAEGDSHLMQLPSVKFLAIDETDRMIERGHFDELQPLLERLNSEEQHKNSRQNFVFSATLTMVHDLPTHLKGKKVTKRGKVLNRKVEKMTPQQKIKRLVDMIGMSDPKVVDITAQNLGTADTLTECRIACSLEQKDMYLYYILKRHPGRTIVFCNSINSVRRLTQILTLVKCNPLPLHASMPQRQRLKNLERFRDNPQGVLVATDVAARGLDIPDIDHVVHYQVPRTAENYVHRSGRTARASKEGLTILMMEPDEAYSYSKLCKTLNKTSELPTFPVPSFHIAPIKDIINLARELDSLLINKKRITHAHGWRERAEREMDMIVDDDDVPEARYDPSIDKALKSKRRQLETLLSRPLFPKGFSYKYPTLNDPNALQVTSDEKALEVMKKALQTGDLKKEKRKGKNASLLKLEKIFKNK